MARAKTQPIGNLDERVLMSLGNNEVQIGAKPTPQSKWIEWVGWSKTDGAELMVLCTHAGTRFAFLGVTRRQAQAMARAESPGKYFHSKISGRYPFLRLHVSGKEK